MKFYTWRLIGRGRGDLENHIFPESFTHPDHFTSLCGERFRALNGRWKAKEHCSTCKRLAPIAEKKAQKKEDKRIARLELRRAATIEKLGAMLLGMSIEDLLDLYRNLKRKK